MYGIDATYSDAAIMIHHSGGTTDDHRRAIYCMIGNLTSLWSSCRELMVPHGRVPAIARTEIDHAMVENDPIKHSIWTRVST